jgi:hypothetical protein
MAYSSGGAGCLILIALFNAHSPSNPYTDTHKTLESRVEVPPRVSAVLRRACYDCHSNATRWPWYSQAPPGRWLVSRDVRTARQFMNFSDWPDPLARANKAPGLLLAACAVLRAGKMPPERYLILHPEAKLSPQEIDAVCSWSSAQASHIAAARRRAAQPAD